MGSLSIIAERIIAKIGNDVVTMLALVGEVMLKPTVKTHWLPISPSTPAPMKAKTSFKGTCSCGMNSDVIQNKTAPPAERISTRSRLSMPLFMASLPRGDINPQNTHAARMHVCATKGLLLFIFSLIVA